nr:unnamed protein product [Spirometra erinaceieuropaei]
MVDVGKFYHAVIDDVINGMQDAFIEDGLDTEILQELKKLWSSKLSDTHAVDPEPIVQTAAQYAQRFQAGTVQAQSSTLGRLPIPQNHTILTNAQRGYAPIIRSNPPLNAQLQPGQTATVISGMNASNLALLRPALASQASTNRPIVLATALNPINPQQSVLQQQQQRAGNPLGFTIRGGLTMAAGQPTILAPSVAGINGMTTANLAGQNVQLVQIGQQTYVVQQPLIQPRPSVTTINAQQPDHNTAFNRTQVDGVGDGSDDDFDALSEPPSIRQPMSISSRRGGGGGGGAGGTSSVAMTPGTGPHHGLMSDEDDDDDDDDDDDLVPATPGLTPPASALSATGLTPRPRGSRSSHHPTFMSTASATPYTPSNLAPPDTPSFDQPSAATKRVRPSPKVEPSAKRANTAAGSANRRYQSAYTADDSDDYDDDYDDEDEDGGVMTPARHLDDGDPGRRGSGKDRPAVRAKREDGSGRGSDDAAASADPAGGQTGSHMSHLSETEDPNYCPPTRGDDQADVDDGDGEDEEEEEEEEEEPLNSGDDVSEEEPDVLFQSENVVVCQYDKVSTTLLPCR